MATAATSTASQLRLEAKRIASGRKKSAKVAKGKKLSGPAPRRLKIRA